MPLRHTLCLKSEGTEEDVGLLCLGGIENPREMWTMKESPFVFLSQTGRDGVKQHVSHPTYWFLTEVLGVMAFLDERSMKTGSTRVEALIGPAYECTHALVLLSPSYRSRPFCVKELNTFMTRRRLHDGICVIPALWEMENVDGYHFEVDDLIRVVHKGSWSPESFIIQSLWPELLRQLGRPEMTGDVLEKHLCRYVKINEGGRFEVSPALKRFEQKQRAIALKLAVVGDFPYSKLTHSVHEEIRVAQESATDPEHSESMMQSVGRCRAILDDIISTMVQSDTSILEKQSELDDIEDEIESIRFLEGGLLTPGSGDVAQGSREFAASGMLHEVLSEFTLLLGRIHRYCANYNKEPGWKKLFISHHFKEGLAGFSKELSRYEQETLLVVQSSMETTAKERFQIIQNQFEETRTTLRDMDLRAQMRQEELLSSISSMEDSFGRRHADILATMTDNFVTKDSGVLDFSLRLFVGNKSRTDTILKETLQPFIDQDLIKRHNASFIEGTREWIFNSFAEWIAGESVKNDHRVFIFAADAGVGKTSIVCRLIRDNPETIVAYHFCQHDVSVSRNAKRVLLSLTYQLCQRFPYFKEIVVDLIKDRGLTFSRLMSNEFNVSAVFSHLIKEPINATPPPNKNKVILIDGLDELSNSDDGRNELITCMERHFDDLPIWLKVYVTARPQAPFIRVSKEHGKTSIMGHLKKFNPFLFESNSSMNNGDLRICFHHVLNSLLKECPDLDFDAAVEELVSKSNGLFVYAKCATERLRCMASEGTLSSSDMTQFPLGMDSFYKEQVGRFCMGEDYNTTSTWRVLKMVVVAKEPLHVELVQELIGCSEKECNFVTETLSTFLPIRNEKIHLYHRSFADWLTDRRRRSEGFYIDTQNAEEVMARRCLVLLKRSIIASDNSGTAFAEWQEDPKMPYLVRHTMKHLLSTQNKKLRDRSNGLAFNIRLIIARAQILDTFGHFEDCSVLWKKTRSRTLGLLMNAIRLSLPAISHDIRVLPSQLVGRLLGSFSCPTEIDPQMLELQSALDRWRDTDYGFDWWCPACPCWEQADDACIVRLDGHLDTVNSVSWSPNGTLIASTSDDETVRLWDPMSGQCIRTLVGHSKTVLSVAWSPDGKRIVSGSGDRTLRIWNSETGEQLSLLTGHEDWVRPVDWSHMSDRIASGSDDTTVRIWNPDTGEAVCVLKGHTDWVRSVSWAPTKRQLASASRDKTVRIWDTATEQAVILTGHDEYVASVCWSPDGKRIASGSWDTTLRVWDTQTWACLAVLRGHSDKVHSVAWSTKIASASWDKTVRIWDPTSFEQVSRCTGHANHVKYAAWSPDKDQIASASADGTGRIWDAARAKDLVNYRDKHAAYVSAMAFSEDGKRVASASADESVRLWDPASGECIAKLEGHKALVCAVAWLKNGRKVVSQDMNGTVMVWDVKQGQDTFGSCVEQFSSESFPPADMDVVPDGDSCQQKSSLQVIVGAPGKDQLRHGRRLCARLGSHLLFFELKESASSLTG